MKILVINGPNLNMLDYRDKKIYGTKTIDMINKELMNQFPNVDFEFFFLFYEGEIIDKIQMYVKNKNENIIINPGGYTHTSVAILDALLMCRNVVEVHLSDVTNREEFRKYMITTHAAKKVFTNIREQGYFKAVEYLIDNKYII